VLTKLLTFSRHIQHMFFPLIFQLEELESNRRRQVMLAAAATAVPVMEMHLSLAALYQDQAAALVRSRPPANREAIERLRLVIDEPRRTAC
jgi:hypothetical protein